MKKYDTPPLCFLTKHSLQKQVLETPSVFSVIRVR